MPWPKLLAAIAAFQSVALLADSFLRKGERLKFYDRMLTWWDRLASTKVPDLPSMFFQKIGGAIARTSLSFAFFLAIAVGSVAFSSASLTAGCYIDWSEGAEYVPVKVEMWPGSPETIHVGIKPVSLAECGKNAIGRIGLILIGIAIPIHIITFLLWKWLAGTILRKKGLRRILISFVGGIAIVYCAFPLAMADNFIGRDELLFTGPATGGAGLAGILYVCSVIMPLGYSFLAIALLGFLRAILAGTRFIMDRFLGSVLEVPISKDDQSFRPFAVLAAAISTLLALGNALAATTADLGESGVRIILVTLFALIFTLITTVCFLARREPIS